jgi:hypothetical protein
LATFSTLQQRVKDELIDAPTVVTTYVPTWINAALFWLQAQHNFQVMQSELQVTTSSTPALGSSQTHVLTQIPADWKCKRGIPYYAWFIGYVQQMEWFAEREYTYRQWNAADYNQVGPPCHLLIGEAENAQYPPVPSSPSNNLTGLNIEVFPFPDGSSDWSDGNYRIHIPYYRYLAALSAGGDTNWFTLDGPQAEFVVRYAVWQGFLILEDEQRASVHKTMAVGAQYDGSRMPSLGGWARMVVDMDKGIMSQPARQLGMRRDVYAPRDQRRQ